MFICFTAPAQSSINLGLSYGRGFSYTKYSPFTRVSGIAAEFTTALVPQTDLRFSAAMEGTGPINYREQGVVSPGVAWDGYFVIPLRVGVQHYVYEKSVFVFSEAGAGIGYFPYDKTSETSTRVNLSYALGGGYRYLFGRRSYLQGSLSYNRNPYKSSLPFSFSWLLFKVAYGINWGNKD